MNFSDIITRHAAERPQAPAIVEGDAVMRYGGLDQAIWRMGAMLRGAGIAPGDLVGVSLPHSSTHIVAFYALARIGAAYVQLPLGEPEAVREGYARRFGVRHILGAEEAARVPGVPLVRITREALDAARGEVSETLRADGGDRLLGVWRTSGTTGEAKGVGITHRQQLEAEASRDRYYPDPANDRLLAVVDTNMAYGLNSCVRTLHNGGTVFLPRLPLALSEMLTLIDRHDITRLALTPNVLDELLPLLPADGCRCPGLRDVTVAGMAVPEALRKQITRRFTPNLFVRYGSNESGYVTHADAAMQEKNPDTVGAPIPGVELEVVDADDKPLPRGRAGEVRARASWMLTGYYKAPELDAKTFRGGWVYLGDIGVFAADGTLSIVGRVDDMINFDGLKIIPSDIEEALLAHPAVREAAAFPVGSRRHHHLPVAAVTLRSPVAPEALVEHCRERLGLNRAPVLVTIETAMPRNAMGKIVRRELAEKAVGLLKGN